MLLGCSAAAPAPPKPNLPQVTPLPSPQTAAAVVGDDVEDVAQAFQIEVINVADEAEALSSVSCEGLQALARQDPQAFQRLRDLSEVLRGVARNDPSLASDSTRMLVEGQDQALANMDLQLGFCGIPPTRTP